jgi:hypothetical protein
MKPDVDIDRGSFTRKFQQVKLEIDKVAMFPTSWIINHPIDEESALFERTAEEIQKMDGLTIYLVGLLLM